MPDIPLGVRLKRSRHRAVAAAQDLMVAGAYDAFPDAVIHGGTALWRCYGGNRFSEDVDFYLPRSARGQVQRLSTAFARLGLAQQKLKETQNAVFARFGPEASSVSFEATYRGVHGAVVRPFETFEGTFMAVRTLRPEELLREKALAYQARRKVRDLYDVYFLTRLVEATAPLKEEVRRLLRNFGAPEDEATLKAVIITGATPASSDMLEVIRDWAR